LKVSLGIGLTTFGIVTVSTCTGATSTTLGVSTIVSTASGSLTTSTTCSISGSAVLLGGYDFLTVTYLDI
jgi:hypothetical protein